MSEEDDLCEPVEESAEQKAKREKEEKEIQDHYLSYLEKAFDDAKNRQEYAVKQFDTLMIGLSTAGLGFVVSYMKDINDRPLILAYASMLIFLACLLINLFSHIFSMRANRIVLNLAEKTSYRYKYGVHMDKNMTDSKFECFCKKKEKIRRFYSILIRTMNVLAFITLLSAITSFILFTLKFNF